MAHQIFQHDRLVLNRVPAWHGLGEIKLTDMTPDEAYQSALNWKVGFADNYTATFGNITVPVETSRTLYRLPNTEDEPYIELGTHGTDYTPVQNSTLIEIAYNLGENVKVESAGSLFNGKKVFISLRTETFAIRNDEITTYIALVNGHDGAISLSVIPTSTRVVCDNTLMQAISTAKRSKKILSYRHFKSIEDVVATIKSDMEFFMRTSNFKENVQALSEKKLTEKDLMDFWAKSLLEVEPKLNHENKHEIVNILGNWRTDMESEMLLLNESEPSAWLAANAVTKYIQHKIPARLQTGWQERKAYSNLVGENADKTTSIMQLAMSM